MVVKFGTLAVNFKLLIEVSHRRLTPLCRSYKLVSACVVSLKMSLRLVCREDFKHGLAVFQMNIVCYDRNQMVTYLFSLYDYLRYCILPNKVSLQETGNKISARK